MLFIDSECSKHHQTLQVEGGEQEQPTAKIGSLWTLGGGTAGKPELRRGQGGQHGLQRWGTDRERPPVIT